jgi:beta-glucosidase
MLNNPEPIISTSDNTIKSSDFGSDFVWGVSSSAFQTEGASYADGKGPSIWDLFSLQTGKIKSKELAETACDFYNRYDHDLEILKTMHFKSFRFSLAWSRILPNGKGRINFSGLDFYDRLIDACLEKQIDPWITLYHWDLPQSLENEGGWTNRDIVKRFRDYVYIVSKNYGDRVNHWMVMNEPSSFTSLGYLLGIHAPGRRGLKNFIPAVHHAALGQSIGANVIRQNIPDAEVGSCFSFSQIDPVANKSQHIYAAKKLDTAINRLFLEPAMGLGYPTDDLPILKRLEDYMLPGDLELLPFEFDFIGLQYYFRMVAGFSLLPPFFVKEIPARKRNVPLSDMNFEIAPEGIYSVLHRLKQYPAIKKIIVTESGVCVRDSILSNKKVIDPLRIDYFNRSLKSVLKARNEGIPVEGFFVWSLTDNFEWAEGFRPRFGLVYVDYQNQNRIIKSSGNWFREFLAS